MIEARHITKLYRIPHEKAGTLFGQIVNRAKGRTGYEDFYALRDVSFSVHKGEMVGLVGKNGSGKTTLLKILGGIIEPSGGSCSTEGMVAPLISLGVGFHNELSAKENLYLYGAILGMPRKAIHERLDEAFAFAGVRRFADMKLKHFSSGMIARLAFAMMIQTDPDVLLLDEIFAVGDKDFVPKCIAVIEAYKRRGKTIVFASHNLRDVANYCDRTLLLHEGNLVAYGGTREVLAQYDALP